MAFKATKGQGSFRIEVEPQALRNLISTLNSLDKESQGRVRDAAQGAPAAAAAAAAASHRASAHRR